MIIIIIEKKLTIFFKKIKETFSYEVVKTISFAYNEEKKIDSSKITLYHIRNLFYLQNSKKKYSLSIYNNTNQNSTVKIKQVSTLILG